MCGIAGEVNFRKRLDPDLISMMVQKIRHRGPDDEGLWVCKDASCILGHARSNIIDLSSMGHQPMLDPNTGNCIVFDGKIYNSKTLRRDCEREGEQFRSDSDAEVVLALYRLYGVGCLKKLRGMFAFAIWDERNRQLFLARDRMGKKPLNYTLMKDCIIFCSEIDPLSRHPEVGKEIDFEALELYLQLQYIPAPWTIYRGIRKLPPAHYALMDEKGFRLKCYWDINYTNKISIREQDALEGLEEKVEEALRLRLISNSPVGALLSGGVDSSLIVALMAKMSGERVSTFSIGFREEAYNELPFAQQVAEIWNTIHHPEILDGNVEELLPILARHYGEPYADSSAVPSFIVCRAARQNVKVVLIGDGGDDILGGYSRYWLKNAQIWISRLIPDLLSPSQLTALAARLSTVKNLPARAIRKLVTEYSWPELRSVSMYAGFWDDHPRRALMQMRSNSSVLSRWRTMWLHGAMLNADNPVDRMLWYDTHTYLPGDLLVKMDIASRHCGLEIRSPLLDHEVIEFCASLPVQYKVRNGIGKYLLKRLAERYYPRVFVYRRKMGFGIPLAEWLRGPLRGILDATIHDPTLIEPLSMGVLLQTFNEFKAGTDAHAPRLWTILMYGIWRKHYLGKSG